MQAGNHPDMIDGVDELEGDVVVSTTGKCSHCGEVYIRENFWTM
jgi:Fe-S cluster biogenesis protein NfuA